jgi:hypothetical protein
MNKLSQADNNPNDSNSTPEQKNQDTVDIVSFMEEGNLQKEFFPGKFL